MVLLTNPGLFRSFTVKFVGVDLDLGNGLNSMTSNRVEEATAPPCMTGNSRLIHQHQNSVGVAVEAKVNQYLDLARKLALVP